MFGWLLLFPFNLLVIGVWLPTHCIVIVELRPRGSTCVRMDHQYDRLSQQQLSFLFFLCCFTNTENRLCNLVLQCVLIHVILWLLFVWIAVFNDGTSKEMLCLDGTIPVMYKGYCLYSLYSIHSLVHCLLLLGCVQSSYKEVYFLLLACYIPNIVKEECMTSV